MDPSIREGLLLARHLALFLMLVVALYTDIAWGKIYNWLVYPAIGVGLAAAYLSGDVGWGAGISFAPDDPQPTFMKSAAGLAAGGGILFVLYLAGGMGGGDVKLMAAVGALSGLGFALWALFYTSIVGAVLAVAVLIWKGRLAQGTRGAFRLFWPWRDRSLDPERVTLPYGAAIALGTTWAWWLVYVR